MVLSVWLFGFAVLDFLFFSFSQVDDVQSNAVATEEKNDELLLSVRTREAEVAMYQEMLATMATRRSVSDLATIDAASLTALRAGYGLVCHHGTRCEICLASVAELIENGHGFLLCSYPNCRKPVCFTCLRRMKDVANCPFCTLPISF